MLIKLGGLMMSKFNIGDIVQTNLAYVGGFDD